MINKTRRVRIGGVAIGGGEPVAIQSMLSKRSDDIEGNVLQAKELMAAGCQIIRISVPDNESIKTLTAVKAAVSMPVVADIHFDHRLALLAVEAGADKIRLNPGNIGGFENVALVAKICKERGVPIRVGVNSGSLEKDLLNKHGAPTAQAMVESTARHVDMLERLGFYDIVLAMKSPYVKTTLDAYRLAAERFTYPLHLGVTEAGTLQFGMIKSAAAIGSLIADGIGDTLRVSLSANPVEEVYAAKMILRAAGVPGYGPTVVACPTCGRTRVDVTGMAEELEVRLEKIDKDITVAVMGCIVNGPGEASQADYGIAGGDGRGVIFRTGKVVDTCSEDELIDRLISIILSDTQRGQAMEQ